MAEEVHDPAVQVPKAIAWSIPIGSIVGLVFLLPIVFTLPDIATLLSGELLNSVTLSYINVWYTVASGQPIGLMFQLIMGSQGGGFAMVIFPSLYDNCKLNGKLIFHPVVYKYVQ